MLPDIKTTTPGMIGNADIARNPLVFTFGVLVCVLVGVAVVLWSPSSMSFIVFIILAGTTIGITVLARPMLMISAFLLVWGPTLFLMKDVEIGTISSITLTLNKLVGLLFLAAFSVHLAARLVQPRIISGLPGPVKRYLIFGVIFALAFIWSPDKMRGSFDLMRFAAGTAILITIVSMARGETRTLNMIHFSLVGGILIAALITVAIPLVGLETRIWSTVGVKRVAGTLGGPGGSSGLFVNGIAGILPLLATSRSAKGRILWSMALILLIVGVVLTVTRSAIIGVPLLVGLWFWFQRKVNRAKFAVLLACAIVAVTYGGFLVSADPSTVTARIEDIPFIGQANLGDDAVGTGRMGLLRVQLQSFRDAPLLTKLIGRGVYSSFVVSEESYFGNFSPPWLEVMGPHNCYIYLLNEFGLIGLVAYLSFIFGTITYIYASLRRVDRGTNEGEYAGQWMASFLAFFITYHLTSEMFGWNIPDFSGRAYFMVFLGIALTIASRRMSAIGGVAPVGNDANKA